MKGLIRNILREQLTDKGDEMFDIEVRDVKIIQQVVKFINKGHVDIDNKYQFIKQLREKFIINDPLIVTKLLLIAFFNSEEELTAAGENKDIERLYKGPFFFSRVDYWDDVRHDIRDEMSTCSQCDGSGDYEDECSSCYGREETEDCDNCEGSGGEIFDCDSCEGMGEYRTEESYYIVSNWFTMAISTKPIKIEDYGSATDVLEDVNILTTSKEWVADEVGDEYTHIEDYADLLEKISDSVVLTKTNIINNF